MSNAILTFGNRTAVITGGTKNIGLAIALKFAQAGMQVAVISSSNDSISHALKIFDEKGYDISTWKCDISKVEEISNTLDLIYCKHKSIDVLVNCAGLIEHHSIEDTKEEIWDTVIDVNLKGAFFMIQKCVPYLKKSSSPRIINISSNAGRMGGYANGLSYTASKGGMISLTYGLARKLAPFSITVNCVAPGTIESEMSRSLDQTIINNLLEKFPLGRFGNVDDVACAVIYFASIESSFTTGAVLDVNGGLFMG